MSRQKRNDAEYQAAIELMLAKAANRSENANKTDELSVDSEDESGWTPLFIAAAYNKTDLIRSLVMANADVNHKCTGNGWTALTNASYWGHYESVILLLTYGADPLLKSEDGLTAIDIAANMKRKSVLVVFERYFELKKIT